MSGCLIAVIGILLSVPANCHWVAHVPNILQRFPLKRPCKAGCSTRETLLAYPALPVQKDSMHQEAYQAGIAQRFPPLVPSTNIADSLDQAAKLQALFLW